MLRFLDASAVPFTNNLAERDLRMKISGCFRSEQGARDFATLRRVLSTAGKQGRNRIEALPAPPRTNCWPSCRSDRSRARHGRSPEFPSPLQDPGVPDPRSTGRVVNHVLPVCLGRSAPCFPD